MTLRHPVWLISSFVCVGHDSFMVNRVWCIDYGVATISRLPKIIGLFCKRAL